MKPVLQYPCVPSDFGIIYREVSFKTVDGLTLKGWFYPAQDTAGIANEMIGRVMVVPDSLKSPIREYESSTGGRPTIIICDGDGGNMSFSIFYAYHYFTKGYNVFTFDWRGFGQSDPWNIDEDKLCCAEFLIDYNSAIDFVKSQPEVDPERIGLMGFSTGAYLSFAMIASRNDISAYIGRALITDFKDLLKNLQKVIPDRKLVAPEKYPEKLLPIKAAGKVKTPVFLIVGQKDNRTPVWMSEKVYKKLKGPKELWIVQGAEHGGAEGPEMITYPEFFVKTLSFFDKYLTESYPLLFINHGGNMKKLKIRWQRLVSEQETCPRCGGTESELEKAVSILKKSLAPLGIEVVLEKRKLSISEFKKDPLQSNRIWINERPIEEYIKADVGQSPCCDVCGPNECRTIETDETVYETVPAEVIIRAGLIAASQLFRL